MPTPIIMPRATKYGNNYWNSVGPKVGKREVILYSDLEFDHWVKVETTFEIETYCEQYPEISFVHNGELHSSVFDMWIKLKDGTIICREVKYESELNSEDPRNLRTLRQIEAQQIYCAEKGINYEVVTEKDLRSCHHDLENRIKIISFVKNNSEPRVVDHLSKYILPTRMDLHTLSDITSIPYPQVHNACLWLFYHGVIRINIDETIICKQSEVWIHE